MKKAIQFGAGKIGRGFLAQLLTQSGYEVIFIDINDRVVSLLNERKSYIIKIVGENPREVEVKDIRALDISQTEAVTQEIATADVVFTAVGANALESIAPVITRGLEKRADIKKDSPLNIILCENLIHAQEIFKQYVIKNAGHAYHEYLGTKVGFVAAIVSRMVPDLPARLRDIDPLMIVTEEYDKLPVDKTAVVGEFPEIKGIVPTDDLGALVEKKLFIHNAGHSLAAYLGYKKGYEYIYEAISDKNILSIVTGALRESSEALVRKHDFKPEALKKHIDDLMKRFGNKALADTVVRGARSPIRKLSFNDRLIGAARLALEYKITPDDLALGIAAAIGYDNEKDSEAIELQQLLKSEGIDAVLVKICGLQPSHELFSLIKHKVMGIDKKGILN